MRHIFSANIREFAFAEGPTRNRKKGDPFLPCTFSLNAQSARVWISPFPSPFSFPFFPLTLDLKRMGGKGRRPTNHSSSSSPLPPPPLLLLRLRRRELRPPSSLHPFPPSADPAFPSQIQDGEIQQLTIFSLMQVFKMVY